MKLPVKFFPAALGVFLVLFAAPFQAHAQSSDATLAGINLNDGELRGNTARPSPQLAPAFDPQVENYLAFFTNNASGRTTPRPATLSVSPQTRAGQSVQTTASGSGDFPPRGTRTYTFVVTAADGRTTKTYTVLALLSHNSSPHGIVVSDASDDSREFSLTPVYSPLTGEYNVVVPFDVSAIKVRAIHPPYHNPASPHRRVHRNVDLRKWEDGVSSKVEDLTENARSVQSVAVPEGGQAVRLSIHTDSVAFALGSKGDTSPASEYFLNIVRAPAPHPLALSALEVVNTADNSTLDLTPEFEADVGNYVVRLPNNQDATLKVRATAAAANTASLSVRLNGAAFQASLASGALSNDISAAGAPGSETDIIVQVTGASGSRQYTVRVIPPLTAGAASALSALSAATPDGSAVVFDRAFHRSTRSYSALVPRPANFVKVTATPTDSNASMTLNGAALAGGAESGEIALSLANGGANKLELAVTAADRQSSQTYTLNITRTQVIPDAQNARLRELRFTSGALGAAFSPDTTAYTAALPGRVRVIAAPEAAGASIRISGDALTSGDRGALAAGTPSAFLLHRAPPATSTLNVEVTASDGATTKTYTVTITNTAQRNIATLDAIRFRSCERQPGGSSAFCSTSTLRDETAIFHPPFAPGDASKLRYAVVLPNTSRLAHLVLADATDGRTTAARITSPGHTSASGDNRAINFAADRSREVRLEVTADDGTRLTYILTVSRAASSKQTLSWPAGNHRKAYGANDPAIPRAALPVDFATVFSADPVTRAPGETPGVYNYRPKDPIPWASADAAARYTLSVSGNLTIPKRRLTHAGTLNKVYDGSAAVTQEIPAFGNVVGARTVNGVAIDDTQPGKLYARNCAYADKNAGENKQINCELAGESAAYYELASRPTGSITPLQLTVFGKVAPRVYDGTTAVTGDITILSANPPLQADEDITLSASGGRYADINAGFEKQVTAALIAREGGDKDNYRVENSRITGLVNRRPLHVTPGGTAATTPPNPQNRDFLVIGEGVDEGLVGGDTAAQVFTGAFTLGTRTPASGRGTQPTQCGTLAIASGLPGDNYWLASCGDGEVVYTGAPAVATAPRNLTASAAAAPAAPESVQLSWQAPDPEPHPPITTYRVRWRASGGPAFAADDRGVEASGATSHTVSGLTGGVEYEFQVFAVNDEGDGAAASATATPRAASSDATLRALDVNTSFMAFRPAFDPAVTEYSAVMRNNDPKHDPGIQPNARWISATTNHAGATVQWSISSPQGSMNFCLFRTNERCAKTREVPSGMRVHNSVQHSILRFDRQRPHSVYTFAVTAEDGSTKTYTMTAYLTPGFTGAINEARAHSLRVTGKDDEVLQTSPNFHPNGHGASYTAALRQSGTFKLSADVYFSPSNIAIYRIESGTATLLQNNLANNTPSNPIDVAEGGSVTVEMRISVGASSGGGGQKNYRVTVTRPRASSDATLSAAALRDADGNAVPLVERFAAATKAYTAFVGNETTSVTLTPTADRFARVTVNGAAVAHGSASAAISLSEGENTINVAITAEDGAATDAYTFTVTRYPARIPLAVTPNAHSRAYGEADPALDFSATGFTGGDDKDAVFSAPPFSRAAGDDAGAYAYALKTELPLISPAGLKYTVTLAGSNSFTITPREVTIAAVTATKTYDGSADFAGSVVTGGAVGNTLAGENLEMELTGGVYGSASVGSAAMSSPVAALVSADGSAKPSNYQLPSPLAVTGVIERKPVTVTATGASKPYDGGLGAPPGISGVFAAGDIVGSDAVSVVFGDYDDKDVADASAISYTLGGAAAGNYAPGGDGTVAASITPKTVTVADVALEKTYDGTTAFGGSGIQSGSGAVSGAAGSEQLALTAQDAGTYAQAGVGSNLGFNGAQFALAAAGGGADVNNYQLPSSITVRGVITRRTVEAEVVGAATKVYDGTDAAPAGIAVVFTAGRGPVSADLSGAGAVSVAFGAYDSKNVADATSLSLELRGAKAANYQLATAQVSASITKRSVTAAAAVLTKVYDGGVFTAGATLSGGEITGEAPGEQLVLRHTANSGAYAGADVSANVGVSSALYTLAAAPGSSGTLPANYNLPAVSTGGVITKKAVTVSAVEITKTYDGGSAFGASSVSGGGEVSGEVSGQNLDLRVTGGVYAAKNVAASHAVTSLAFELFSADGTADPGNYSAPASVSATGAITKLAITYTLTAGARVYDATTAVRTALGGGFSPAVISGDDLRINTDAAAYANANAGVGKSITGAVAEGADLGNYEVTITGGGDITRRTLRLTAEGRAAEPPADLTDRGLLRDTSDTSNNEGPVGGHTLAQLLQGAIALGTRTPASGEGSAPLTQGALALTSTAPGSNYTLVFTAGVFTFIDPNKPTLVVTPVAPLTRVYGEAAPTSFTHTISLAAGATFRAGDSASTQFFTGEPLALPAGAADAGQYDFQLADPLPASAETLRQYNFVLDENAPRYTITRKTVSVAAVVLRKEYDATTAAGGATLSGGAVGDAVGGESLTLALAAVVDDTYDSADAGSGIGVTASGAQDFVLQSGDGSTKPENYQLPAGISVSGVITPKTVAVGDVVLTKVYDATTDFGESAVKSGSGAISGTAGGEELTLTARAGTYASAGVGAPAVTIPDVATAFALAGVGGAKPDNYALPSSVTVSGEITARPVTAAATGATKPYDGALTAPPGIALTFAESAGIVAADDGEVSLNAGDYNDKDAADAERIAVSLSGGKAGNYRLSSASVDAAITPKELTVGAITLTKVYDSTVVTAVATLAGGAVGGVVDGEAATLNITSRGAYASANAGTGIAITGAAFELAAEAGTDAANYELPEIQISGVITAKPVNAGVASGNSKVYDANLSAPPQMAATFAAGDIEAADGEAARVRVAFGEYDSADVADASEVAVSLAGTSAGNYALAQTALPATITKRGLRVAAVDAVIPTGANIPDPADLELQVGAAPGEGYAPGEDQTDAFTGALAYGPANADLSRPIERGNLAATANYEILSFTAGLFTIGLPFDADENDTVDGVDGLLIARYLLGLRGAALVANLENVDQDATADSIAAKITAAGSKLDVDRNGGGKANAADGIMIARYFLGVTEGPGLTFGQSSEDAANVARNIADTLPQE
ncbi:MAG: YDG domain-containing protein [Gammaproteobacteria bacterium]|nr:YDG domain-containing protein [Gammaproteobacteria bacterium]